MNFIEVAKLVVTLLPILIDLIKKIEEAIPGKGKGEEKLEMLRTMLESAYNFATPAPNFDVLWPTIKKITSGLVTVFNKTGVF